MTSPLGANSISTGALPRGELLGRYSSYLDAQKLVDYLADNDFPVSSVTIVGNDLRSVERVTAKLSYPKVALAGAAQGAMMGFFVGLLLTLFSPGNGLYQILSAIGLGMAIWMIAGVISYSTRRGKRDFASSSQFVATSYDVVVDFANAQKARTLASQLPMRPNQQSAAPIQPVQPPVQQPPVQQPTAQQPVPVQPGVPQTPASQPAAEGEPEITGNFNDLPDGRPRYGVRVNPPAPEPAPAAAGLEQGDSVRDEEPRVRTGAEHGTQPADQQEGTPDNSQDPENKPREQ